MAHFKQELPFFGFFSPKWGPTGTSRRGCLWLQQQMKEFSSSVPFWSNQALSVKISVHIHSLNCHQNLWLMTYNFYIVQKLTILVVWAVNVLHNSIYDIFAQFHMVSNDLVKEHKPCTWCIYCKINQIANSNVKPWLFMYHEKHLKQLKRITEVLNEWADLFILFFLKKYIK